MLISHIKAKKGESTQILALSATIPNGDKLAEWLDANYVHSEERIPPLVHEIWVPGSKMIYANSEDDAIRERINIDISDCGALVEEILRTGGGPVAVMATQKNYAKDYSEEIASRLPTNPNVPENVIEDFRSMSDDSPESESIAKMLKRGIGVHHGNLGAEQRRVVEDAFLSGYLDVIVATPTLIAGVNLPIRTVLYPYPRRYAGSGDVLIDRSEYVNGAGRAGRKGFHDNGKSIIVADSLLDARKYANYFIQTELNAIESQVSDRSKEFFITHLLAAERETTLKDLSRLELMTMNSFEKGYVSSADDLKKISANLKRVLRDDRWKLLWDFDGNQIEPTRVCYAIAESGLEPSVAIEAYEDLTWYFDESQSEEDGNDLLHKYLARLCICEMTEYYLPFKAQYKRKWIDRFQKQFSDLFKEISGSFSERVALGFAYLLVAIEDDAIDRSLSRELTINQRSEIVRISDYISHLILCSCRIANAVDSVRFQSVVDKLNTIGYQLFYRVDEVTLPIEILFANVPVRSVGPQRRKKLAKLVRGEVSGILKADNEQLIKAIGKGQVDDVIKATLIYLNGLTREQSERQLEESKKDPELRSVVGSLLGKKGTAFEPAVESALRMLDWSVKCIDVKGVKGKADIGGKTCDDCKVLLECKTTERPAGEISKNEAFDVAKKVPEGFVGIAVTVGRPMFCFRAEKQAYSEDNDDPVVHLVTCGALIELLLATRLYGLDKKSATKIIKDFIHVDVSRVRREIARIIRAAS
jgi:helicase